MASQLLYRFMLNIQMSRIVSYDSASQENWSKSQKNIQQLNKEAVISAPGNFKIVLGCSVSFIKSEYVDGNPMLLIKWLSYRIVNCTFLYSKVLFLMTLTVRCQHDTPQIRERSLNRT